VDLIICIRRISRYIEEEYVGRLRERGQLEYETSREFLADIRKKFGEENEEIVKVAELKRLEQRGKIMEEFIQEFWRTARESGYEERLLVEKFKRGMNETIC